MRKLAMLLLMGAGSVGCGGTPNDGFAVDITVRTDGTVMASSIATLILSATGAESYTSSPLDVVGKLTSGHAGIRYKPGVASGTLDFALTAEDAGGHVVATGTSGDVVLKPGATVNTTIVLSQSSSTDMGVPDHGVADLSERDEGPARDLCVIKTVADCDDGNPCTVDGVSDNGCGNSCTHTPEATAIACTVTASPTPLPGVCLGASCCSGCIDGTTCRPGTSDSSKCGVGGNDCVSCTDTTGGTCAAGACSGCTETSCSSASQVCGSSSCGYNCGSCPDSCVNGVLTHYTCSTTSCTPGTPGGCGNYATCKDSHTCNTDCSTNGNNDCVSTAYCNSSKQCVPKGGLGAACTAEGSQYDYQCQSGLHCTWLDSGAVCAHNTCTGCNEISTIDYISCTDPIPYQLDPRHSCTYVDSCHQNYCSGRGTCDDGFDTEGDGDDGNPRACGTATCTNASITGGEVKGTLQGALCVRNATSGVVTCMTGQTWICGQNDSQADSCMCASSTACGPTTAYCYYPPQQ